MQLPQLRPNNFLRNLILLLFSSSARLKTIVHPDLEDTGFPRITSVGMTFAHDLIRCAFALSDPSSI